MEIKGVKFLKNKRLWTALGVLIVIASIGLVFNIKILKSAFTESELGVNEGFDESVGVGSGNWFIINSFDGFQTKVDATKISNGANPLGQNTSINDGDRVSVRNLGYDLFPSTGTASTSDKAIQSLHTFRKRNGENIMIRANGTILEYYDKASTTWDLLKTGLTDNQEFGFADSNINTDIQSYVYFGNGVDDFARWTGSISHFIIAPTSTAKVLFVDDNSDFNHDTGTIIYCGTEVAYTKVTNTTFEVASAHACGNGSGVTEAVETFSGIDYPKGNIYLNAHDRLWIAGIASTTQAVYFSAYGDAQDFSAASLVSDSTDASTGIFNLGEGGGGVTGMVLDENSIYIFKRAIIYKASLTDTTYTLTPLKAFDGKSQTIGAVNNKSIFTSGNAVLFITPDNQIMSLQRVEDVDYPQVVPISDAIKPTTNAMNFASSTGIVYKDRAYFSTKENSDILVNNTVLVYDIKNKFWDSPILGLNVNDFTVYDDGTSEKLYFGDVNNPNVFEINTTPLDYIYGITANWRSKQFNFGNPAIQKEISNVYIEGYISANTTLSISLLLDEDGFTQVYSTDFVGTEEDYLFETTSYNLFGFNPFGTERFGTQDDQSGAKKFRIYLNKNFKRIPFYNAQLEFASSGENQQWEIISFGFEWMPYSQPEKRSLYRIFQ